MAIKHSTGLKNYALSTGIATAFDTDGRIAIYTGSMPATADTAAAGTLLGTLTMSADSFGAPASGAITAAAITNDSAADASGTPGYFVMYKAGETALGSAAGATDKRLFGAIGAKNQLNGAINSSVTTITVDDTTHFPSTGAIVIDSERISYTGKTGTTFTGCTRGASGTTAASHTDNTIVYQADVDMHFDSVAFAQNGVISLTLFVYNHSA